MTAVSRTSLIGNAYEAVFTVVNDRNNINDPRNSGNTSSVRKIIYESDPFNKALDFSLFPYIVLSLPTMEGRLKSTDGRFQWLHYTQEVTLRSVQGGSGGNRIDAGKSDLLNMSDDLMETFKKQSVLQGLRTSYIYNVVLDHVSSDTTVYDDMNVFESVFELRYHFRLQVSA